MPETLDSLGPISRNDTNEKTEREKEEKRRRERGRVRKRQKMREGWRESEIERERENCKIRRKKKTAKIEKLWYGGMLHMLFFPSKHTNFTQFQTMNYKYATL